MARVTCRWLQLVGESDYTTAADRDWLQADTKQCFDGNVSAMRDELGPDNPATRWSHAPHTTVVHTPGVSDVMGGGWGLGSLPAASRYCAGTIDHQTAWH